MRAFILLLPVTVFSLSACTKSNPTVISPKDSVLTTLVTSVLYYDEINQIYSRKDSISYNPGGHLANWIYYSRKNGDTLSPTQNYSFVANQDNKFTSYTLTTFDFWGGPTSLTYNLTYNAQNKLSNKIASPPGSNPLNDFNVFYQYDPNNIFYSPSPNPSYDVDTLTFQNKNMIFRAHFGIGEVARGDLRSQEYRYYSSYPNPFYNPALANSGALFFTCLQNDLFEPQFDYLGDVLSGNLPDSIYFTTYLGALKRDRGYYTFSWMLDNTGKVVSGDYTRIDTTSEYSGYESLMIDKFHINFSYKNIWIY